MNELTDSAVRYSKISPEWIEFMKEPKTVIKVKFPVELRNNEIRTITGIRVIHSNHLLPTKGGLRFSVDTAPEDLEGLANIMSFKAALHNIPFGGSKGCIYINPSKFSYEEKVRIVRRFTVEMMKRSMINSATDVMNPDVGTDEKIMNVVKETYKTLVSNNDVNIDSVVTGKSVNFGGIGVSKQAAGYGLCRTASFVLENLDNKILKTTGLGTGGSKKSVIIQGFGQIGYNMAKFLVKNDFKVVGMTDENVGCFNPMGFDPDEVYAYKKKNDGLQGISKSLNKPEDVLSQKCDIFVSSDREMNFTKNMAEKVRCKLFIEACNAPATKDALDILNKRGIVVIPDVISYSGGFIVSYLEWLKNLEHRNLTLLIKRFESNSRKVLLKLLATSEFGGAVQDNFTGPTEDELVLMTIDEIMDNSFRDVLAVAEEFNIDLKTAAFKLAIERIYNQYKNLGGFHL